MNFLNCDDAIRLYADQLRDTYCCVSCHEDHDENGFELIEIEDLQGNKLEVCCTIVNKLRDNNLLLP